MSWKPHDITPTELALLRSLWKEGPSTIRELTDRLYPGGEQSHYSTVQSLLDRLRSKSCVEREKHGRVNVFRATVSQGELIRRRLRDLAESLCEGSMAPLLSHLVEPAGLSPEEITALEKLAETLDRSSGGKDEEGS